MHGNLKELFRKVFSAVSRLRQRLVRNRHWPLLVIIVILVASYLIGGVMVGYFIYQKHQQSPTIQRTLYLYPLPAILVSGQYITVYATYRQIRYIEHFGQKTGQNVGSQDEVRGKVIDRIIEQAIIDQVATKNRLRVSDKEIQDAFDKVVKDNGGEKPVVEVLRSLYGMSIPEFKKLITQQLLKQKVKENVLVRVQPRHILIQDEQRAKEVLDKIKNRGNFDELAKEFSQDANSRDKGGDLGFVNRGQLSKEVEEVIFKLKAGELTQDLVKSSLGFHIIRLESRNSGTIDLSYDDLISQYKQKNRIIRFLK